MDGQRFDNLARKVAAATSRRGFLRALAGSAIGLVAARVSADFGADDAAAQATCTRFGRACSADGECCATMVCRQGKCTQGCRIDGTFHNTGAHHPDNPCLACRPRISTTAWSPVDNGTTCDDGDLCTRTSICKAGVCTAGKPKCGKCKTCDPATGACQAVANGTRCDDGNACTLLDYCQDGVCHPGSALNCVPQKCKESKCNPQTGQCEYRPIANGTVCRTTAPDACHTNRGTCQAGDCVANEKVCPECRQCDPERGCVRLPNGTACDTGDPCLIGTCKRGVCKGTPNDCGGYCFACEPGVGCVQLADGTACDNGNPCDTDDHCESGACVGTPVHCPQCQQCVPSQGGCIGVGNDFCETPCYSGMCGNGECYLILEEKDCSGLDAEGGCLRGKCDTATGQCLTETQSNGTPCSNGEACTRSACWDGLCLTQEKLVERGGECGDGFDCCVGLLCIETMHSEFASDPIYTDKCQTCEDREGEPCQPDHGNKGCCPSQDCECDSTQQICSTGFGWACKTRG